MWWLFLLLVGWILFCAVLVLAAVIVGGRAKICEEGSPDDPEFKTMMRFL